MSNLDLYGAVLNEFSKPVMARTDFTPPPPVVPATGNDPRFFRFFDATAQALFLYRALERTVGHDLEEEIHYLLSVERARFVRAVNEAFSASSRVGAIAVAGR